MATTDTMPLPPGGTTAVQVVVLEQLTPVASALPKRNCVLPAAVSNPAPVMLTVVPAGPVFGEIDVSDGTYVKTADPAAGAPSTVAVTVTEPAPAGEVPVHVVLLEQLIPAAAVPPKLNVVVPGAVSKLWPVKVTVVPPAAGPDVGEIEASAAGGGGAM